MNRRRLLAMLPFAPIAALMPAAPVAAEVADTRMTFSLKDYVLVPLPEREPGTPACVHCGAVHRFYDHACTPVAGSAYTVRYGHQEKTVPATRDSIPYAIFDRCVTGCVATSIELLDTPHDHSHDFRWVD